MLKGGAKRVVRLFGGIKKGAAYCTHIVTCVYLGSRDASVVVEALLGLRVHQENKMPFSPASVPISTHRGRASAGVRGSRGGNRRNEPGDARYAAGKQVVPFVADSEASKHAFPSPTYMFNYVSRFFCPHPGGGGGLRIRRPRPAHPNTHQNHPRYQSPPLLPCMRGNSDQQLTLSSVCLYAPYSEWSPKVFLNAPCASL